MKNDIKELDRASLDRVIRLTNDSKIYTKIMKNMERKGVNLGLSDIRSFVTAESMASMSELSNLKYEY
jgi:hypothetical protein